MCHTIHRFSQDFYFSYISYALVKHTTIKSITIRVYVNLYFAYLLIFLPPINSAIGKVRSQLYGIISLAVMQ